MNLNPSAPEPPDPGRTHPGRTSGGLVSPPHRSSHSSASRRISSRRSRRAVAKRGLRLAGISGTGPLVRVERRRAGGEAAPCPQRRERSPAWRATVPPARLASRPTAARRTPGSWP
jgi:hypothetical protein